MSVPFRWNITKREQLGSLVTDGGPFQLPYPEFFDELRFCSAKVVAFSRDCDLIFVGRSPESVFDYLSGIFANLPWEHRLSLFNVSLMWWTLDDIRRTFPPAIQALRDHLTALHLHPVGLLTRDRPVVLVDVVHSGGTMKVLTECLLSWAEEMRLDLTAIRRKIRYLGLTRRKKTSPNTWRWQQDAEWLRVFPADAVKNVSLPVRLWDYLGNSQPKVAKRYPPNEWGAPECESAPKSHRPLEALQMALVLYERGLSKPERFAFGDCLVRQSPIKEVWLRSLVVAVRHH
jgi:hypothetical protein